MQIHRVRGSNLRDALMRARRAYGEDALVIGQEVGQGGITLAVARRAQALDTRDPEVIRALREQLAFEPRTQTVQATRAPSIAAAAALPQVPAAVNEVLERVRKSGASPALLARLCAELTTRADAGHAIDRAARVISEWFPPARSPRIAGSTRLLAFAGATGVGKTTSLIKVALRMLRAGRRIELATLDSRRVGAVEQLRAYAGSMHVPLTVMRRGVRLCADAMQRTNVDAVLLDTTGHPAHDAERLNELEQDFARTPVIFDAYLVLAATSSPSALEAVGRGLATLRQSGVVVTKLDETPQPAAVLEYVLSTGFPLAFFSDGIDVARNLRRVTADSCADLLLRGKLS